MKLLLLLSFSLLYAQQIRVNPFTGLIDLIGSGGSTASTGYSVAVTAQTTLTVTAATHGQGTSPVAACFDNASPAQAVACSYTRNGSGELVFTWAPAFTGSVNIFAGGGTAGVSGGSNLTTVGAIPYVSASGVLSQDSPGLHWDATNNWMGVGTASPTVSLDINGDGRIYDSAAATTLSIRSGGVQGTTDLLKFQDSAGNDQLRLNYQYSWIFANGASSIQMQSGSDIRLSSTSLFTFSDSGDPQSVIDTGWYRNAAGVLEINNGTAGTFRDLKLRSLQWTTNTESACDATVRGTVVLVVGGAGVADTFRICTKASDDSYAYRALY